MRFSKYILTLLLISGSALTYAQQTDTLLTLQKCLDIAVKNNLNVKQSFTNQELDRIGLRQAKENLLPSISGNANRTFFQGRGVSPVTNTFVNQSSTGDSYGINGNLTLFNGLALINAVKSASLAYQAGKMDFQAAKDAVTVNVITSYLAVLDNQELLAAAKSQLAVQKEAVDRLQVYEQQGANKAASDLTDAKGQYASNQLQVVNQQNSLETARLSLFQLLNISYQPQTHFEPLNAQDLTGNYGSSADQIYETALQTLAQVKAATLRRQSAEKAVSSARGVLLPTLSLGGGVGTAYASTAQQPVPGDTTGALQGIPYNNQLKNNYNSSISLGLSIPIFSNGVRRNSLARAKINLLSTRDIEDNTKVVLRQNIEQAYYNMTAAYRRYQALEEQVKAYSESYRIYKLRFEAGVLTSAEFIISKNNMDSANLNLISSRYEYYIDSKILDYYQGKLSF